MGLNAVNSVILIYNRWTSPSTVCLWNYSVPIVSMLSKTVSITSVV